MKNQNKIDESIRQYLITNVERIGELDTNKKYEMAKREHRVWSQMATISKLNAKRSALLVDVLDKKLSRELKNEVSYWSTIADDFKSPFRTKLVKFLLGALVCASIFFVVTTTYRMNHKTIVQPAAAATITIQPPKS